MRVALIAALLGAVLGSLPCQADSFWNHNNSVMRLRVEGDKRIMVYEKPRAAMVEQGVRPGTVLFEVVLKGNLDSQYRGTAHVFSARCGRRSFEVRGQLQNDGTQIALSGKVTTIGSGGCQPTGMRDERIIFDLVRSDRPAPTLRPMPQGSLCNVPSYKQYRVCLEKEANWICRGRPTYEDLVWCWRKAVLLVYENSGLVGLAKSLAIGDEAPFTICERGECRFAGGGSSYSCKRTDVEAVSECDGDRCTRVACPIRQCRMLCSASD